MTEIKNTSVIDFSDISDEQMNEMIDGTLTDFDEGDLVDAIQKAYFDGIDGIVFNPAAYTHTSVAIADAAKGVGIPTVEVHISEVSEREAFRQVSYIRDVAVKTICGHGLDGYNEAVDFLIYYIGEKNEG